MKTKAYVISTTTALALGLTAGFTANSITAGANVPFKLEKELRTQISGPALACFSGCATAHICPEFDADLGFKGAERCKIDDIQEVSFIRDGKGTLHAVSRVKLEGNWTRGAAR
jgi:hypothetical protein